jgi:4-hydroxy-tetrahydrodipicolinate synthase
MSSAFWVQGVIVPILTPLTQEGKRINAEALAAHLHWLVNKGIFAVMPCGTTGEGPLMQTDERKYILEQVMRAASGQIAVIAHVGGITTHETIELARHAHQTGADAISVVTPYYYRLPDLALAQYYIKVAEAVPDMPVFLYNIPHNTGNALTQSIVAKNLSRSPNIVGIKDSSGNLASLSSYIGHRDGKFQVICGSDGLLFEGLKAGALASVSGNANIFPDVVVPLVEAYQAGDLDLAAAQQQKLDTIRTLLEDGSNISLMKRILEHRGLVCGNVRPPLKEVSTHKVKEIINQLRNHNLL